MVRLLLLLLRYLYTTMLGDLLEEALRSIGVTTEVVEDWLGRPCGCKERQEKLNQLGYWAKRVMAGKKARAKEYLQGLLYGDSE